MTGGERQCQALPIFTQGIDGEQSLARTQGVFAIPALIRLLDLHLQQACGDRREAGAFPSHPGVERLDIEPEPGQELTAIETKRVLRIATLLGECRELVGVRREE